MREVFVAQASVLPRKLMDLRTELQDILNKHDPLGLLKHGAPPDEYDFEVDKIIECIYQYQVFIGIPPKKVKEWKGLTILHIQVVLFYTFTSSFGAREKDKLEDYEEIANEILSLIKKEPE